MTEQQQTAAVEPVTTPDNDAVDDGDVFDASYVRGLRAEAARHRTAAREAAAERDAARAEAAERAEELLTIRLENAIRDADRRPGGGWPLLADRADLLTFRTREQLLGEDGQPDPERIAAAIKDLTHAKPHLAYRVPGIEQGPRFDQSLSDPSMADVIGNVRRER